MDSSFSTEAPGQGEGPCSCAEARAQLDAYLDKECDQALYERLARHVATCDHCQRIADAEVHLRDIVSKACAEQAPRELKERVLSQLSVLRTTRVEGGVVTETLTETVTETVTESVTIRHTA